MKHAVVLGGSVAGLLTARVLSEHADIVSIVEPDPASNESGPRRGAPQGAHAHILLGRGQEIVEEFLPGLSAELVCAGAQLIDVGADGGFYFDGWRRVPIPGEPMLSMTRPFFEAHLRRRVLALGATRLVHGHAIGLTATGDRIDGVQVRRPGGIDTDRLPADLVVDATGRASRLADWLTRLGYDAPPRQQVNVDIGYATCFFHRTPQQRLDGVAVAHSVRSSRTGRPGAGSLSPVEGSRWMALITGYQSDRPTRELPDFLARCRDDPAAPMRLVAEVCEPVGEVATYRFPGSVRRDLHRMKRFPAGLVVAGDAAASFNPIYGQGMSSAALHAQALAGWLRGSPRLDRAATGYFRRLGRVVDAAWATSAANDRLLPHVRAGRALTRRERLDLRVGGLIGYASLVDARVAQIFNDVVNMRREPSRLRWPDVLVRGVRANRRRARGEAT